MIDMDDIIILEAPEGLRPLRLELLTYEKPCTVVLLLLN